MLTLASKVFPTGCPSWHLLIFYSVIDTALHSFDFEKGLQEVLKFLLWFLTYDRQCCNLWRFFSFTAWTQSVWLYDIWKRKCEIRRFTFQIRNPTTNLIKWGHFHMPWEIFLLWWPVSTPWVSIFGLFSLYTSLIKEGN